MTISQQQLAGSQPKKCLINFRLIANFLRGFNYTRQIRNLLPRPIFFVHLNAVNFHRIFNVFRHLIAVPRNCAKFTL